VLERTSYLSDAAYKDLFENKFESEPFYFQHKLNTSPLFQSAKLRELCGYCASRPSEFHIEIGKVAPGQGWLSGTISNDPVSAFDQLATSNTLIMLKGVSHPEYRALLADYLREVSDLLGFDFSMRYRNPKCTIILASPGRVTPYHMDAEQNLLMQVQGTKQFYVFDGGDPDVLSTESLERFWGASELNAARYTPELQNKAMLFELGPGSGVHVPLTFPHWAQNGPEISVAVSINFQSLRCDQANVFRVNHMLRRLGFNPPRPGVHKVADAAKSNLVQAVIAMKRISPSASRSDHD
jgi:Cupin-like domain